MPGPDPIDPPATYTRRELVMTTLAIGFAAAVQPVTARTQIRANGVA